MVRHVRRWPPFWLLAFPLPVMADRVQVAVAATCNATGKFYALIRRDVAGPLH